MPINYADVRADLVARRDALDAVLAALDRLDVLFDDTGLLAQALAPVAPTTPPQPAPTRRSSPPAPAPAPGPSNIEKSQHWQAQATKALRAGEGDATVRELAARLRLTGDEAYQSLWRALQVLVAHKAVVRTGTRYRLAAAAQGEAA